MLFLKIILFVATVQVPMLHAKKFWTNYTIDAVRYWQMPTLNKLDEYEACMESYSSEAKYCFVRTAIKPDTTSDVYNYIKEFSSMAKQHFRHDKLTRGVCINTCKKMLQELGADAERYFVPEFKLDYKINFDFIGYPNASTDREELNKIVNQCINIELGTNYNLTGYSSIEYCVTNEDSMPIDWLDIFFVVAVSILIVIIYMSTTYDEKLRIRDLKMLKIKIKDSDHYKTELPRLKDKFLVAFSMRRNWYLLSAPIKKEMRDMRAISAVRIWSMICIFYGHCSWFAISVPLSNPIYVEQSYHRLRSMIVVNGSNLVQTFFFISGFLNSVVLLAYVDTKKVKNFTLFIKTIIYRYIRFAPVLLFLVLLHATFLYRFDSGPFWNKFNFVERQGCRENMWTNLLFINNYVSGDLKCMVHTWFIASDFHLSIIGCAIVLLSLNYPKARNWLLFGSFATSFIICFTHFYITKLEPVLVLSPETLRNQLMVQTELDRYFYDYHSPTHLNTGNYLAGIVMGYFYYLNKKTGVRHRRTAYWNVIWHCSYLMTFFLTFVGIYFFENTIEKGVVSALIAATLKHIYGPVLGVLLIGIFFRYGWIIPKMYNYGMYRVLARLSFSVYMVHLTIGSLLITGQKYPIEINNATLNSYTGAVYMISHGCAAMLALCIEIPAHVIYKAVNEIIEKPKRKIMNGDTNNNGEAKGLNGSGVNGNVMNGQCNNGIELSNTDAITRC